VRFLTINTRRVGPPLAADATLAQCGTAPYDGEGLSRRVRVPECSTRGRCQDRVWLYVPVDVQLTRRRAVLITAVQPWARWRTSIGRTHFTVVQMVGDPLPAVVVADPGAPKRVSSTSSRFDDVACAGLVDLR
jgi:hypothetical protein